MSELPTTYVYMDHAATTPLRPGVLDAMLPYLSHAYGNPSAAYKAGRIVRAGVDNARDTLADLLGCQSGEVYFTSGGTEAINLAIKGYVRANQQKGKHILVSSIEHHAVLHAAEALAHEGYEVETIPVNGYGEVDSANVATLIRPDTLLVAVMHANNEVGTVQPMQELSAICRQQGVALCVDAVQTAGHLPLEVLRQVPFFSVSAHKFGGPKGVGALVARRGFGFQPLLHGGGQERERRAGTENVAGVVGMATALHIAYRCMSEETGRLHALAGKLRVGLAGIPNCVFSGHPQHRLPGLVHVCFQGVSGESLLLNLDRANIAAASGSACTTGSNQVSHVLLAMGVPHALAAGALRLSLGYTSTQSDVDTVLASLPPIVDRLRSTSRA